MHETKAETINVGPDARARSRSNLQRHKNGLLAFYGLARSWRIRTYSHPKYRRKTAGSNGASRRVCRSMRTNPGRDACAAPLRPPGLREPIPPIPRDSARQHARLRCKGQTSRASASHGREKPARKTNGGASCFNSLRPRGWGLAIHSGGAIPSQPNTDFSNSSARPLAAHLASEDHCSDWIECRGGRCSSHDALHRAREIANRVA